MERADVPNVLYLCCSWRAYPWTNHKGAVYPMPSKRLGLLDIAFWAASCILSCQNIMKGNQLQPSLKIVFPLDMFRISAIYVLVSIQTCHVGNNVFLPLYLGGRPMSSQFQVRVMFFHNCLCLSWIWVPCWRHWSLSVWRSSHVILFISRAVFMVGFMAGLGKVHSVWTGTSWIRECLILGWGGAVCVHGVQPGTTASPTSKKSVCVCVFMEFGRPTSTVKS